MFFILIDEKLVSDCLCCFHGWHGDQSSVTCRWWQIMCPKVDIRGLNVQLLFMEKSASVVNNTIIMHIFDNTVRQYDVTKIKIHFRLTK